MKNWHVVRDDPTSLSLTRIKTHCKNKKCPLFKECCQMACTFTIKPVEVMFIGEGAGKTEHQLREPFVGESGALLKATITWLVSSRLNKDIETEFGVAFDNLVKARPTTGNQNRAPTPEEFECCKNNLFKNIKYLKPKVIVTLGEVPYRFLLSTTKSLANVRGCAQRVTIAGHECWLVPTWHPARCLRDSSSLPDFVEDLRLALLSLPVLGTFLQIKPPKPAIIVDTVKGVKKLVNTLKKQKLVAFDTEAININRVYDNKLLSVQFSYDGINNFVIPLYHPETPFTYDELEQVRKELYRLFAACPGEGPGAFIAHNAVFDLHQLRNNLLGLRIVPTPVYDTMLQAYLLEENHAGRGYYTLKRLARRFGFDYEEYYPKALQARNSGNMDKLTLKELADYGGADAAITLQLYRLQFKLALLEDVELPKKIHRYLKYFYHPLNLLFVEMESLGLPVNVEKVKRLVDKDKSPVLKHLQEITKKFYQLPDVKKANKILLKKQTGTANSVWGSFSKTWVFDVNKPDHKRLLFFKVKKLKSKKEGKSGKPSLDRKVLKEFAAEGVEEAILLMRKNEVSKMFDSFIKATYEKLLNDPDAKDQWVRPSFHSTGTVTGRLSASNPNCLAGSTLVILKGFGAVQLSDIYKLNLTGAEVVLDGNSYRIVNVWETKHEQGIAVKTVSGRQLVGSLDHRLLVVRGSKNLWLPMSKIVVGDKLVVSLPSFNSANLMAPVVEGEVITVTKARLAGEAFKEKGGSLPSWLFKSPPRIIRAFIEGMVGRKIAAKDRVFIDLKDIGRKVTYDLLRLATFGGIIASSFYYDDCMGLLITSMTTENSFILDEVRSITRWHKPLYLYDIEVEGAHCFLADGIVSHNSQQIPKVKGDDFSKEIRRETRGMFEAPPGLALAEIDYSTNEVRGLAMVSKDPHLTKVFVNLRKLWDEYFKKPSPELKKKIKDADPHRVNAAVSYGIRPDEVSKEMRDGIKVVTFGTIYGMSVSSLAAQLGVSVEEAQQIKDKLFASIQVAKRWLEITPKKAAKRLYVDSLLGRRRRLYYYLLPNAKTAWADADRRAVNSPIQGMSSDLACIGAFLFYLEYIIKNRKDWGIANLVHDSNLPVVPLQDVPELLKVYRYYMTDRVLEYVKEKFGVDLGVPLDVEVKVGINLANMVDYEGTFDSLREVMRFIYMETVRRHGKKPRVKLNFDKLEHPCI